MLKKRRVFSVKKRRVTQGEGGWDNIFAVLYLRGGYRKDGVRFFLEVHSKKMWDNGYKFQHGKFWLDIQKKILVEHWNGLPRETVAFQFLEMFKKSAVQVLEQPDFEFSFELLCVGYWTWWPSGICYKVNYFTIMWFHQNYVNFPCSYYIPSSCLVLFWHSVPPHFNHIQPTKPHLPQCLGS